MIAIVGYQLAALLHSQRYLPPVLAFLALNSILYGPDAEPVTPGFGVTAGAMFLIAGWLTIALIGVEDPVQRAITRNHTGSIHRFLIGTAVAPLVPCAVLTLMTLVWSYLAHTSSYPVTELFTGLAAHVVCACAGSALGVPCSRLLIPRIGYTLLIGIGLFGVVLLVPWIPLIHPLLRAMISETASGGPLLVSALSVLVTAIASELLVARFARE